jgi:hypothetical protein
VHLVWYGCTNVRCTCFIVEGVHRRGYIGGGT